jgi:glucan phosphoethanolaminetransferase (alkaline phosphatase superfamily)
MRVKHAYLILAILGLALTYYQLFQFMAVHGVDMVLLFSELFRNDATSFFGFDLLVTALAAVIFMYVDGIRIRMRSFWIPILCVFAVGAAFGFPLYLYLREGHMERRKNMKKRQGHI